LAPPKIRGFVRKEGMSKSRSRPSATGSSPSSMLGFIYVGIAVLWFVPDRRIEKRVQHS
jgi:hypothetical protein